MSLTFLEHPTFKQQLPLLPPLQFTGIEKGKKKVIFFIIIVITATAIIIYLPHDSISEPSDKRSWLYQTFEHMMFLCSFFFPPPFSILHLGVLSELDFQFCNSDAWHFEWSTETNKAYSCLYTIRSVLFKHHSLERTQGCCKRCKIFEHLRAHANAQWSWLWLKQTETTDTAIYRCLQC